MDWRAAAFTRMGSTTRVSIQSDSIPNKHQGSRATRQSPVSCAPDVASVRSHRARLHAYHVIGGSQGARAGSSRTADDRTRYVTTCMFVLAATGHLLRVAVTMISQISRPTHEYGSLSLFALQETFASQAFGVSVGVSHLRHVYIHTA
jgi:hypothetical protein